MKRDRERIYRLEGTEVRVTLRYDEAAGRHLADFPNLEETPVYTVAGHLCVEAAQDACPHGANGENPGEPCLDCGSCGYYAVEQFGDLIGICKHPNRIEGIEPVL